DARGVRVPPDAIAAGIASAEWPGRLELRRLPDGREILLDAAHNPAGAAALASYLHEEMRTPSPLVFTAMRDKDYAGMLQPIVTPVDGRRAISEIVLTRASNPRS